MPHEKSSTEKIPLEEAFQRIQNMCINNAERVSKLEEKYNQVYSSITQKHEEMEARIIDIQSQTTEMHIKMISTLDKAKQQFDAIKEQCNDIVRTLCALTKEEQQSESQNIQKPSKSINDYLISTQPVLNIDGHSNNTNKTKLRLPANAVTTSKSHTIIIPSPTAIPTFSGKYSESPNHFLIRIQEYAETVYGWDQPTLLLGISQFLRDTALDWYCQLRASHRRPQNWLEFVALFRSQFHSPIQIARQEQEWYECKQWENETINEFLIRLRAIWSEHKPKETEVDFIKHLLCKMRSDLLTMMGVITGASLDDIISEAQNVEEILYRRNQEQCLAESFQQISFKNNTLHTHTHYNDDNRNQSKPTQSSALEYLSDEENAFHQRSKDDTKKQCNNDKSLQDTNNNLQLTTGNNSSKKSPSIRCRNCGIFGHFFKDCRNNNADFSHPSTTISYHSKNEHGASGRRDVDARP
jgi:hypothetical protein